MQCARSQLSTGGADYGEAEPEWELRSTRRTSRASLSLVCAHAPPCLGTHLRAARRGWRTVVPPTQTPSSFVSCPCPSRPQLPSRLSPSDELRRGHSSCGSGRHSLSAIFGRARARRGAGSFSDLLRQVAFIGRGGHATSLARLVFGQVRELINFPERIGSVYLQFNQIAIIEIRDFGGRRGHKLADNGGRHSETNQQARHFDRSTHAVPVFLSPPVGNRMHSNFGTSPYVPCLRREEDERACRVAFPEGVHDERPVSNKPRDVQTFFKRATPRLDLQPQ